ncbi:MULTISPECIES: gamma-glutamylcyclotransferase [Gammaproteobacteria]|uniref:gamma-glutamylcyclotransferase n=1 Tax=Gammaproteobacteria TaxID=1236 RepID=UPI000DCF8566|nr:MULTISPECIES: gamma-glutamylcyclotransferase [Gammaproteobacteria]RTE86625.1 gamma-glutamylcyclotransferase [Aliidiomarina sp. B3213]TCZ90820.1 gamma-glutamylcyclotransferase [Lysobacter sp. N42]
MAHDTQTLNKNRMPLHPEHPVWVFGYGSLIHKVDFPYLQRRPAYIEDWQRRFWQGSHDHRGTPEAPGRVLTLIPAQGQQCVGMAYQVKPEVFEHLDHREKNGYLRIETALHFVDGNQPESERGLVYIAGPDNAAYLGPASDLEIAQQIACSEGPSGPNDEYVLKLAEALRQLDTEDDHVFSIESLLVKPK